MVKINVTGYGAALYNATFDPIEGLNTTNATAPLQQGLGLRQYYEFGLYSYCGYINSTAGTCGNHTAAAPFHPFQAITNDLATNYSVITTVVLANTTLIDSKYLGQSSSAAYYLILLGTILSAVTFFTGLTKRSFTFVISGLLSVVSTVLLLAGASIWTVLVNKSESVNSLTIGSHNVPAGIIVSSGTGLSLVWASFVCSVISVVPYMLNCFTYRG